MRLALTRLMSTVRRARLKRQRKEIAAARERLAELRTNAQKVIGAQALLVADLEGKFLGQLRGPVTARTIAQAIEQREKAGLLA